MATEHRGFTPDPKTAMQWTNQWVVERGMWVPRSRAGVKYIDIKDIKPIGPSEVRGDPDLLVTAADGKRFYVLFPVKRVFQSLDLPLLVYPPDAGLVKAFWVVPVA